MAGTSLAFEILAKDKASRVFEKAADSADELNESVSRSAAGLGRVGEGADTAETRVMGLKDGVEGLGSIMQGPGEQGIAAYLQGWADFASGVANFAVPAFQKLSAGGVGQVKQTAIAVASTARAVAAQVAQWVVLGVQSTIHAAKVAAAWLISMGPIVLVGAAVAGLVYLIIEHWDTIKRVVAAAADWVGEKVSGAFNWMKDAVSAAVEKVGGIIGGLIDTFKKIPGWIGSALSGLADIITKPYRMAFNAIATLWNNTVGKLSFKIPSWVPGIGGKGFDVPDIPLFDMGGGGGGFSDEAVATERSRDDAWAGRKSSGGEQHLHVHAAEFTLAQAVEVGKQYQTGWASLAEVG